MDEYSGTSKWRSALRGSSELHGHLKAERRTPYLETLEEALKRFSPGERFALYLLTTLLFLSALVLLANVNAIASVVVPVRGGSLTEGETGPARFINPVLAISQADQDISALVYSGLTRALPDGTIVPDLASSYTISPDGTTYTFHLRSNATFQNGTKVTAADVLYTIQATQDAALNSPQRANWTGVTVSSPDQETVVFTLPHAYAPFIRNTTLGILPKSLWENVSDEEFPFSPLNTKPIGSGPYEIQNVSTDSTGAASRYDLTPFDNYALGAPYLSRISFVFFDNDTDEINALSSGAINAAADLSASELPQVKNTSLSGIEAPLPRDFGVFFNQSHNPALADLSARQALDAAIDKQGIVDTSLDGRGVVLSGPIPPDILGNSAPAEPTSLSTLTASSTATSTLASFTQNAETILQNGGWKQDSSGAWTKNKQTLSFTLATADEPELISTANALAADWKAAGIQVSVQVYPLAQLNTNVIRPRAYDALLFGEVVGPELDLYAFWHSSQRADPGLNLALYANSTTDTLLSQARATTDEDTRDSIYQQFASDLEKDEPAIFLYAPDFLYVVPSNLSGVEVGALDDPSDRFGNVYEWYTDTQYEWAIFAPPQYVQSY